MHLQPTFIALNSAFSLFCISSVLMYLHVSAAAEYQLSGMRLHFAAEMILAVPGIQNAVIK